jgi:hypothetical protein
MAAISAISCPKIRGIEADTGNKAELFAKSTPFAK